jgi:hypothetical protein
MSFIAAAFQGSLAMPCLTTWRSAEVLEYQAWRRAASEADQAESAKALGVSGEQILTDDADAIAARHTWLEATERLAPLEQVQLIRSGDPPTLNDQPLSLSLSVGRI